MILAAVLTAGCAKEIEDTSIDRNSAAIELSSVSTDPMTKAVITGTSFTTDEAAEGIGLFLLDKRRGDAYGSNPANVRYTFSSDKWTAASPLRVGNFEGLLYGYYPYNEDVTGINRIPVESSINGTDYLYAAPVEVTTDNAKSVSLSLNHALARVSLSFRLDESYVGDGVLSEISLSGDCVAATGTLNAKTGRIGAAASIFSASGLENILSWFDPTTVECLVVPVENVSGTPELKIDCTIGGKAYSATFTGDFAALTQGKQTIIELTVKNTSIEVNATSIGTWGEGGSQTVTVGGDYKVTIKLDNAVSAHDVLTDVYVDGSSVIVKAYSLSGRHLKCTMDDGEFCTIQSKTSNLAYTFTISDMTENSSATIGYAAPVSISLAVSPADVDCKASVQNGDLYEGETVRLVPEAAYSYGISNWKDQNGNVISDGYDYTVRLSEDMQTTACFEENLILGGEFTLDYSGKTVRFTRGNLYYDGSCRVEQHQYDFNSASYTRPTAHVSHFLCCRTLDGAIMQQYAETEPSSSDTFFTNQSTFTVSGFDVAGTCFSMSAGEWDFLLTRRTASTVNGTQNARYFKGCINKEDGTSINGLFLFPDEFTWPASVAVQPIGINETSAGFTNSFTYNDFKRLQDAGIVFLPAAGSRPSYVGYTNIDDVGSCGRYWSANPSDFLSFNSGDIYSRNYESRQIAMSVRLVTESK